MDTLEVHKVSVAHSTKLPDRVISLPRGRVTPKIGFEKPSHVGSWYCSQLTRILFSGKFSRTAHGRRVPFSIIFPPFLVVQKGGVQLYWAACEKQVQKFK